MLGISTCWWHKRVDQGDQVIQDILELGLNGIELEYRITESMYHQMRPQLKQSLNVFSIHNFFPAPDDLPGRKGSGDLFLLSSTDPDERSRAVQYSIRTLDHANELGTKVVILHLGRVDMPYDRSYLSSSNFLDDLRPIRKARHQKNLDAVLFSLDTLNQEAERRGIFFGIENRYHFNEIPDFQEMEVILNRFKGGNVHYWHDVGHARAQENMGIIPQMALLKAYSGMMIGIHLHDIKSLDDHLAPGQGEMDFEKIRPFLQPSHIKILEVHSHVAKKDLIKGINLLKTLGIE